MLTRFALGAAFVLVLPFTSLGAGGAPDAPPPAPAQGEWEVLEEIQPYGPFAWDMTVRETIDALVALPGVTEVGISLGAKEVSVVASQERFGDDAPFADRVHAQLGEWLTNTSMSKAEGYEGFEGPVVMASITLVGRGASVLGQDADVSLIFRFDPGMIATRPSDIERFEMDEAASVALAHRLSTVVVECEHVNPADAHHVHESLQTSIEKRFGRVKRLEASPRVAGRAMEQAMSGMGGMTLTTYEDLAGVMEQNRGQATAVSRLSASIYATGQEDMCFIEASTSVLAPAYQQPAMDSTFRLVYSAGERRFRESWDSYVAHIEARRRAQPRPAADISDDL